MGFDGIMHAIGMTLQVFFLDLILSGDNAVLIALACRRLPKNQMRQVILMGTGFAFLLRVVLTTVVSYLLTVPSLRLIGGVALVYIALKLLVDEEQSKDEAADVSPDANTNPDADNEKTVTDRLWSTVSIVVVADLVMSMDNVVALAAVAQDNMAFLVFGLLLSIPLLMFGSFFVTGLLNRYPVLVPGVAALLGWIAGDIAVADPLIADWVNTQSPGLAVLMPVLSAIFVLVQSKIVKDVRQAWGINDLAARKKTDRSARILAMSQTPASTESVTVMSSSQEENLPQVAVESPDNNSALHRTLPATISASIAASITTSITASVIPDSVTNHTTLDNDAAINQASSPENTSLIATVSDVVVTRDDDVQDKADKANEGDEEYDADEEDEEDEEGEFGEIPAEVSGLLSKLRENGFLIGGICLTALLIFVFTHFGKSFIPAPAPMTQFECPGYTGKFSLYYKHGGEKIQIRTAGRVINGSVNYGKLQWENYADISTSIGFTLPEEIVSDSGRSVQINGGSFRQISCMRTD